jgi:hypothetical protein
MIQILYQLMCACLAALCVRGLFVEGSRQEKILMAVMLVPLVLRLLLIK